LNHTRKNLVPGIDQVVLSGIGEDRPDADMLGQISA